MEKSQKTIAVTAIGSWGDVLPYVVLAEDLHKKGYHVIVGAAKRYEEQILKRGRLIFERNTDSIPYG